MSKGAPRRKRGTYAHQPTISSDILTCLQAAEVLSQVGSCCSPLSQRFVLTEVVQPSLRKSPEKDLVDHLSEVGARWVLARKNVSVLGVEINSGLPACEPGCELEYEMEMYADLVHLISSNLKDVREVTPTAVDDAVRVATDQGYDGESLASEVIVRETGAHTGLLHKEISKLRNSIPESQGDELLGFAWKGLRVALRQFDPTRGYTFSTYACPRINGAIRDGVRAESHLPKRLTTVARKLASANEDLTRKMNTTPSMNEICEYLGVKEPQLVSRLAAPSSLDELSANSEGSWTPGSLVDESDPAEAAGLSLRSEAVIEALRELGDNERAVLVGVYFQEKTLTAVAKELKVDVRVARGLRDTGFAKLREQLEAWV